MPPSQRRRRGLNIPARRRSPDAPPPGLPRPLAEHAAVRDVETGDVSQNDLRLFPRKPSDQCKGCLPWRTCSTHSARPRHPAETPAAPGRQPAREAALPAAGRPWASMSDGEHPCAPPCLLAAEAMKAATTLSHVPTRRPPPHCDRACSGTEQGGAARIGTAPRSCSRRPPSREASRRSNSESTLPSPMLWKPNHATRPSERPHRVDDRRPLIAGSAGPRCNDRAPQTDNEAGRERFPPDRRERMMNMALAGVAETLANEFAHLHSTAVLRVLVDCVDEFPNGGPHFVEQVQGRGCRASRSHRCRGRVSERSSLDVSLHDDDLADEVDLMVV